MTLTTSQQKVLDSLIVNGDGVPSLVVGSDVYRFASNSIVLRDIWATNILNQLLSMELVKKKFCPDYDCDVWSLNGSDKTND